MAVAAASAAGVALGFIEWVVSAFLMGVFALALGALLIPLVTRVLGPMGNAVFNRQPKVAE